MYHYTTSVSSWFVYFYVADEGGTSQPQLLSLVHRHLLGLSYNTRNCSALSHFILNLITMAIFYTGFIRPIFFCSYIIMSHLAGKTRKLLAVEIRFYLFLITDINLL